MSKLVLSGPLGTRIIDIAASAGSDITPARAMEIMLEHGPIVEQIITEYADAGADIILAPTLGATSDPDRTNARAIALCRKCAPDRTVAAMVSMTDTPTRLYDQCRAIADNGADLFMLETLTSSDDACRLIEIALEANLKTGCDIPIHVSFAPTPTLNLSEAAADITQYNPASTGINCYYPPADTQRLLAMMHVATPLSARPALSTPRSSSLITDNNFIDEILSNKQLKYIGACCGASPNDIRYLKNLITHD